MSFETRVFNTRRMAFLLSLSTLLAGRPPAASAESEALTPEALVGLRVRITTSAEETHSKRLKGVVAGFDGARFMIDPLEGPGERRFLPMAAVDGLEIYRGRKRATKDGLLGGAILGGAAGAVFGWIGGVMACDGVADCSPAAKQAAGFVGGAALGGLIGGGVGAGVGSLFTRDAWEPAQLAPRKAAFAIQPMRRGLRVALSVRF
jgi:hypothetical protein